MSDRATGRRDANAKIPATSSDDYRCLITSALTKRPCAMEFVDSNIRLRQKHGLKLFQSLEEYARNEHAIHKEGKEMAKPSFCLLPKSMFLMICTAF